MTLTTINRHLGAGAALGALLLASAAWPTAAP